MANNSWMNHVKRFRQRNANMSYRQVLKAARKTYGGGIVGDSRSLVSKYATALTGGAEPPVTPPTLSDSGPVGVGKGDLFQKYSELTKGGSKNAHKGGRKSRKTRKQGGSCQKGGKRSSSRRSRR